VSSQNTETLKKSTLPGPLTKRFSAPCFHSLRGPPGPHESPRQRVGARNLAMRPDIKTHRKPVTFGLAGHAASLFMMNACPIHQVDLLRRRLDGTGIPDVCGSDRLPLISACGAPEQGASSVALRLPPGDVHPTMLAATGPTNFSPAQGHVRAPREQHIKGDAKPSYERRRPSCHPEVVRIPSRSSNPSTKFLYYPLDSPMVSWYCHP